MKPVTFIIRPDNLGEEFHARFEERYKFIKNEKPYTLNKLLPMLLVKFADDIEKNELAPYEQYLLDSGLKNE